MRRCKKRAVIVILLCILSILFSTFPIHASSQANLVVNGDFNQGLSSWETRILYPIGEYPRIYIDEGILVMDAPGNSSGYVWQSLSLPSSEKIILSLKVWGASIPAFAAVYIGNDTDYYPQEIILTEVLQEFAKVPFTRTYDLTEFSGQNVTLVLLGQGTGESMTGSFVFFDDVKVESATENNSVITIAVEGIQTAKHTARTDLGVSIRVFGQIYPNQAAYLKLEFNRPDSTTVTKFVNTDSTGKYNFLYIPDQAGIWSISAALPPDFVTKGPSLYFVVSRATNISFVSCKINEKISTESEIQVKIGERISGWIRFNFVDYGRHQLIWIVGINSWEENKWNKIIVQGGYIGEYVGVKSIHDFSEERDTWVSVGLPYAAQWNLPLNNDTHALEFVAPPTEGTYYVAVIAGAVVDYKDLLNNEKASQMYTGMFNRSISSVWDLQPNEWEMLTLQNRTRSEMFVIKVRGVDVDPALIQAIAKMDEAREKDLNVTSASKLIEQAQNEINLRNFIRAKELAILAKNMLEELVENYIKLRKEITSLNETIPIARPLIDVDDLSTDMAIAELAFSKGEFEIAKAILDSIASKFIDRLTIRVNTTITELKKNQESTESVEALRDVAIRLGQKGDFAGLVDIVMRIITITEEKLSSLKTEALHKLQSMNQTLESVPPEIDTRNITVLLDEAKRNINDGAYTFALTNLTRAEAYLEKIQPAILLLDSIDQIKQKAYADPFLKHTTILSAVDKTSARVVSLQIEGAEEDLEKLDADLERSTNGYRIAIALTITAASLPLGTLLLTTIIKKRRGKEVELEVTPIIQILVPMGTFYAAAFLLADLRELLPELTPLGYFLLFLPFGLVVVLTLIWGWVVLQYRLKPPASPS